MIYLISIINYLYIIQTDKYVPITEKKKKKKRNQSHHSN